MFRKNMLKKIAITRLAYVINKYLPDVNAIQIDQGKDFLFFLIFASSIFASIMPSVANYLNIIDSED